MKKNWTNCGMPTEEQIATLTKGDYIARKVWKWLCHAKAIGYVPWVLDTKSPSYDPAKAAAQAARDELLAELEEVIATASTCVSWDNAEMRDRHLEQTPPEKGNIQNEN